MIDETILIEEIESLRMRIGNNNSKEIKLYEKEYKKSILKIIEEQPRVNEWIPVEERLPKKSLNSVIGWDTYRERCVFVQYYINNWILGDNEPVNIIAWQPLPKPYVKE